LASGFENARDFHRVIGWELSEVAINKHHVLFWFDNHLSLLNIAHSFSYRSADRSIEYTYEIYGTTKLLTSGASFTFLS
jgi:hypothetical protein